MLFLQYMNFSKLKHESVKNTDVRTDSN